MGRGGKRGTFCGRGSKGQSVRAGRKMAPIIRELIKRYPKLRGYRAMLPLGTIAEINVEILEKNFNAGDVIRSEILIEKRLIRRIKGKMPQVKILGEGQLSKKFIFENCLFSKQAKEKIEKAGGEIKDRVPSPKS